MPAGRTILLKENWLIAMLLVAKGLNVEYVDKILQTKIIFLQAF